LGSSLGQAGQLENARIHLEKALALRSTSNWFGPDPKVLCLTSLSDVLFGLGFPDQSLSRSYEALDVVTQDSDPFSYAMAVLFVVQAHCARGEPEKGKEWCRMLIKLCDDHGFPYIRTAADRCLSWATALEGRYEEGIAMINEQFAQKGDIDAEIDAYNVLPTLAEAYGHLGKFDQAFAALDRWLVVRRKHSIASIDKSFYRIRGELRLRSGHLADAEKDLREAIRLSANGGARIEQLRSTTSLARLISTQHRREEARAMLAEIYGQFTEGFDIAYLKEAKALINELSA
jgi:tetratricopeptide (TPR) repeat protein